MKKVAFVLSFILVLSCLAIGFSAYTFNYEYMDEEENVSMLYSRITSHYHWLNHSSDVCYSVFYKSTPVTYDNLTVAEAISVSGTAFLAFEGTAVYDYDGIFSKASFMKIHETIFGREVAYTENETYPLVGGREGESFTFSGNKFIYTYFKPWETAPDTTEKTPVDVRSISYAEKYVMNGDKLYVFDKYALVRVSEAKDGTVPVYSSSDSSEPIGYLDYDSTVDKCEFEDAMRSYMLSVPNLDDQLCRGNYFSEKADITALSEYEELLTEYVHTFERDGDGNWYWVSSAPSALMQEIPDTADQYLWIYFTLVLSACPLLFIRNLTKHKKR